MLLGLASLFEGHVKIAFEHPGKDRWRSNSSLFKCSLSGNAILTILSADTTVNDVEEYQEQVAQLFFDLYCMLGKVKILIR